MPNPSQHSSEVAPPTKYVPNVRRRFYEALVKDGFQGTFEEFDRRGHFHAYERAVKLGRFQGTYDAWRYEATSRKPGSTINRSYGKAIRVVAQTGQFVTLSPYKGQMRLRRAVLVNGQAVGGATISVNLPYNASAGTLLRMYYDPEKHLLRFQTQNGEPLPKSSDIDLISKATLLGCRPLLVLAHSEGLITTVPDGFLPSFDLQTNLQSGYYIRSNRMGSNTSTAYHAKISFPGTLGITSVQFRLSEPEKFEYLRFFPYIHEDQTFRFWDVERGVDAPLKKGRHARPWEPQYVKKRFPGLFEHAKRLGYWKEF